MKYIIPLALATILVACAGRSESTEKEANDAIDSPNIIFILVDNLG